MKQLELSELKARVRARLKERDQDIELFTLRLQKFINSNLRKILRDIERGNVTAQQAARVLGGLEAALKEAGIDEQLADVERIHFDEMQYAVARLREAARGADRFSNADIYTLEQLVSFDVEQIGNTVNQYIGDLKPIIMRQVIAGEQVDVDALLEESDPRVIANIKSEVFTGVKSFYSAVNLQKAEDVGFRWFIYIGPKDDIIRDFCGEVLAGELRGFERSAPVYLLDEIKQMDNGQGLPVETSQGGYNCRHSWEVLTDDEAKQLLSEEEYKDITS